MVRFGRRMGFAGLVMLAWLAGCNNANDAAKPGTSQASDGGGAPSFATLEEEVGRVLVVGESERIRHFEREYRGLAQRGHADDDLVRCELTSGNDGFAVSIEAAQGRSSSLQFSAQFQKPNLGPGTFEITPSFEDDHAVRVRLEDHDGSRLYEYELDGAVDPNSLCSVGFSTFDREQIVGKAACRRLSATTVSFDASGEGGAAASGPGSASVTFEFSCRFHIVWESSDGKPATGSGGADASGGHGNNSAGTTNDVGGTSGTVAKRCVGATRPCSLRDSATCELGNGCTLSEGCSGFSSSCYGQMGVYACTEIQGCVWASSSQSCIGSAWSCSTFSGSLGCTNQPGCGWDSDCTGVAPLCSSLSEFTCALEPGCRWE